MRFKGLILIAVFLLCFASIASAFTVGKFSASNEAGVFYGTSDVKDSDDIRLEYRGVFKYEGLPFYLTQLMFNDLNYKDNRQDSKWKSKTTLVVPIINSGKGQPFGLDILGEYEWVDFKAENVWRAGASVRYVFRSGKLLLINNVGVLYATDKQYDWDIRVQYVGIYKYQGLPFYIKNVYENDLHKNNKRFPDAWWFNKLSVIVPITDAVDFQVQHQYYKFRVNENIYRAGISVNF